MTKFDLAFAAALEKNKQDYKDSVSKVTAKQVELNGWRIPGIENNGKAGYEVDHIYTKEDGWDNTVAPEIVGDWVNLQVLGPGLNEEKNDMSDVTLQRLQTAYRTQQHVTGYLTR